MEHPNVIVITGASSGLGAALARCYAAQGMVLFLTGRDAKRLEVIVKSCEARGAKVFVKPGLDITDKAAVAAWLQECDAHYPVDLIIANAGISGGTAGGSEGEAQARTIMAVNIDGVLNTIYPLMPTMQARKRGQIAIISSLAGYRGLPGSPAYSASKAAVKVLGEALRGMLAEDKVELTVVTPGYIRTPMTDVNDFYMPWLVEVDDAAMRIKQKLRDNPARIAFPFPLYAVVWLLALLPPCLTDRLFAALPKKG
jgi:short-subunit dehydrogenase